MAGAAKLVDVSGFARTLAGLMPRSTATDETIRALAVAIPMGELLLGVVVITGLWSTVTDVIVLLVMCAFSVTVVLARRVAPHVKCRCFGTLSDSQFSGPGFIRSLVLTGLAFLVVIAGHISSTLSVKPPGIENTLLLVCGCLIFAVSASLAAQMLAQIKGR